MNPLNSTQIYFLLTILPPLLGVVTNFLFLKKNPLLGSRIASLSVWIGFFQVMLAWMVKWPFAEKIEFIGFMVNEITWIIATLILFVSAVIHHFSIRYLAGDRNYRRYFLYLTSITVSTLIMLAADNIVILISFWSISNLILVLLMIHKSEWRSAKNSGLLTIKTFLLGLFFLSLSATLLVHGSKSFSLHHMIKHSENLSNPTRFLSCFLIILAAFAQSGAWPFHRWLISSLNSPTPVSSLMHAGLVNGGGVLLARFSPLLLREPLLLNSLFLLGLVTLILGGIWKLIQSDIKRMLACSTMTQMGFMIIQCSLGLFPAALAHLCWHGLFKAFLFLRAGSSLSEKREDNKQKNSSPLTFLLASLSGAIGTLGFLLGAHLHSFLNNTTSILVLFCWMAGTQIANAIIEKKQSLTNFLFASILCLTLSFLYGSTIHLIEKNLENLGIFKPQIINPIHIFGITLIVCIWIMINLNFLKNHENSIWWKRFYVKMLNASQPNRKTLTSNRNEYKL